MKRRIKKERFLNTMIRSPISYIILIGLLGIFTYSAISSYKNSRIAKQKTRQVEAELQRLVERESGLERSLNDMNTPFGIEKSLREKFGIVKEGEKSVIVVDLPQDTGIQDSEEKKGFWGFLKKIF